MGKISAVSILLLSAIGFLQSCGSESETITTPQKLVSDGQLISLQIDSQTSNVSDGLVPFETENESWLFNLNFSNNEIQLYDLQSKKLKKRMLFDLEGPDGVDFIQGIHVHSMDSIFLFGFPGGELHLTDTSAKIISKISYNPPAGQSPAFIHNAFFTADPILSGQKLLVKTRPDIRASEATAEYLADKKLTYAIDITNGNVALSQMGFPITYAADGTKQLDFSMAQAEGKLIYSFISDHNLYVSDLDGNELAVVPAKSENLNEKFESFPDVNDRTALYNYLFASDRYERLLYDEYRGVFYRFVFPKVDVESKEEIDQLRRYPRKFAVMILDKDLNILGETLLPENTYYPGNSFVSKDGLFISISHPDNPANQEDLMSFEVFKLEEVE